MGKTHITLAYGKSGLQSSYRRSDDRHRAAYLPGLPDEGAAATPGDARAARLRAAARQRVPAGARVASWSATSPAPRPTRRILPVILSEIDHLDPTQVTIFIATGTHRGNTPEGSSGCSARR